MKTRKLTKSDLAFMLIGKAVAWTSLWVAVEAFIWWALKQSIYF